MCRADAARQQSVMDQATARRLVRQHAETARLLGADCVPVYRTSRVAVEVEAKPDRAEQPALPMQPDLAEQPDLAALPPPVLTAADSAERRESSQRALDALRARYEADAPHKHFVTAHTTIVFGEGDPCAQIMFIGEAPGEEEDRTGRPFVGRSGELLNKMIVGMGLSRERVYIANVLKTRPPDNATPTSRECDLCKPYLLEQVAIINPEAIVTLGLPASRVILNSTDSMTKMRGRWASLALPNGRRVPVMPTYHPAYILRNYTPANRALVWSDLKMVLERLGMAEPVKPA